MFQKIVNVLAPMNDSEKPIGFRNLFFANYGTLVPTDLTVWLTLAGTFVGLLFLFGIL